MAILMTVNNSNSMKIIKFFADANYYISVLVLVYGGVTAITENHSIFEFNEDLFGAIHNNLRIALLYMGMTEVVLCLFCLVTKQPKIMVFVGYFLLMMMGSVTFYGQVNSVSIDNNIVWFFLYTGVSHILFGLLSGSQQIVANDYSSKT